MSRVHRTISLNKLFDHVWTSDITKNLISAITTHVDTVTCPYAISFQLSIRPQIFSEQFSDWLFTTLSGRTYSLAMESGNSRSHTNCDDRTRLWVGTRKWLWIHLNTNENWYLSTFDYVAVQFWNFDAVYYSKSWWFFTIKALFVSA